MLHVYFIYCNFMIVDSIFVSSEISDKVVSIVEKWAVFDLKVQEISHFCFGFVYRILEIIFMCLVRRLSKNMPVHVYKHHFVLAFLLISSPLSSRSAIVFSLRLCLSVCVSK